MQEFIPSGRQVVFKHPGLPKGKSDDVAGNNRELDALILHRLKHVSINEENAVTEWWLVRECDNTYNENNSDQNSNRVEEGCYQTARKYESEGSYFAPETASHNDSWSWRTIDPSVGKTNEPNIGKTNARLSDFNLSKPAIYINKSRFSSDSDFWAKSESKSLNKSVSINSTSNNTNLKPNKSNFKTELCSMEEELYIKGCTAVWSRGLFSSSSNLNTNGTSRTTLCSYTMDNNIKHALWCTFYLERPSFVEKVVDKQMQDEPSGKPLRCICLLDSCTMKVFTANNEDFIVSLPFEVANVWATKFGLLIEREQNNINQSFAKTQPEYDNLLNNAAQFYSLSHPLDEFSPVVVKSHTIQIVSNSTFKIIFTNSDPSICFVFDGTNGLHCVYRVRKLKTDEWGDLSVSKIKLCNSIPSPSPASISRQVSFFIGVQVGKF